MTDHDDRLGQRFDQFADDVRSPVDVEASLADLHRRRRRPSRRPILGAAAAVVLLALIGGVVWWHRDDGAHVIADGPDEPLTYDLTQLCDHRSIVFVYMEPGASDEQVAGVAEQLAAFTQLSYEYVDADTTYAEFVELFADQPDLVDVIDPDDLPTSFRVVLSPWLSAEQFAESFDSIVLTPVGGAPEPVQDVVVAVLPADRPEAGTDDVRAELPPCEFEGTFSTEGYSVTIDGEPVDEDRILNAWLAALSAGWYAADEGVHDRAALASLVLGELLAEHGRESGEPVTEPEIDDALLDAESVSTVDRPWERFDPAAMIDDPEVRAEIRIGLERSRGMRLVLDEGPSDPADPTGEPVRAWLAEQVERRDVEVRTPSGGVADDILVALAVRQQVAEGP